MSEKIKGGINRRVLRLTEGAVMMALGTVLSFVKLIDLPYGGSVTAAASVPLILLSYRYGVGFGCFAGLAYGLLQLTFSSSLSYVTGFWSVAAVVVLDFLVAFAAVGASGAFRRMKNQPRALMCGAITYGVLRYLLHVVSGATVWAGISIPTAAALLYSVGYNATYMLPETVIAAAAAYLLGTMLDFQKDVPVRRTMPQKGRSSWLPTLAAGLVTAAVVYDVAAIFPHVQEAETGRFTLANLHEVSWLWVCILSGVAVLAAVILTCIHRKNQTAETGDS